MDNNYYLFQGAKKSLIQWLKNAGITDDNVLRAFDVIERHQFIEDPLLQRKAYDNMPLPIACNQTISQPLTVAFQSQLLQINPNDKVLEIGTGSGFQASILSAMGAKVFTIERQIALFRATRILLNKLKIQNVKQFYGDGFLGLPQQAPFDKIIATCGAPNLPTSLLQQLNPNGIIVIPVGDNVQEMKRITKISDTEYKEENFGQFQFVPMLEHLVKVNQTHF